ncbi:hypothetical protein CRUP_005150, partial [Coryphaenoides rupestris]
VFNMNAPVPSAGEGQPEPLKQPAQFPSGYAQGFSSPAELTVEQADMPQEALQSGNGANRPALQLLLLQHLPMET